MTDKKYERLLDLVLERLEKTEMQLFIKNNRIQELENEIDRITKKQNIMSKLKDKMEVR